MSTQYTPSSLYVAGTIVIGLGGSGTETVRLVKARVRQSMTPPPGIIEFLTADTEPRQNEPGREHLSQGEYAYLGDYNASRVLSELDAHPHIKDWWFSDGQTITGTIHKGARQRRPVGRLSLYVNWGEFSRSFDAKAKAIREIVEREKAQIQGMNVQRTGLAKVYIISSVCGGTGSATFLDIAFRVRQILGDDADIVGVFYLPSCFLPVVQSVKQRQRIKANAYASLVELNHFLKGNSFEASFPDEPFKDGTGNKVSASLSRPFDTVYLVDQSNNKEGISNLENIWHMAAQQIFLDILTPMSARFAARRANLQDLAGEKSKAGDKGHEQSLAIAGFSTASLILPADRLRTAAAGLYSTAVIRERIIGQPIARNRELDEQLRLRLDKLSQTLRFERTPNEADAPEPAEWNPIDELFGSDREQGTSGNAIDLNDIAKVIGEVYEGLCQQLTEDYKTYRLQGIAYIFKELSDRGSRMLAEVRRREVDSRTRIDGIQTELAQPQRKAPWYQIGNARERAEQAYAARRSDLEDESRRLSRLLDRDRQAAETLSRLVNDFNAIGEIVGRHIKVLEKLATQLEEEAQQFATGKVPQRPGRQRQRADIFELATYVGGERYTTEIDGVISDEPYWSQAPRHAAHNAAPEASALESFDIESCGRAFGLLVESGFGPNYSLRLPEMGSAGLTAVADAAKTLYAAGATTDFSIMDYLRWFYKHVRHGPNEARFSPLDPLQMLNDRCKNPFIEVDTARLGTEGGNDTEPVRLLGIPDIRSTDPMIEDVLDDFDGHMWEEVPTGTHDRIDISYSRHGYPVRVLKDLNVFKKSYLHFRYDEGDKLHLHRDWPNGMDDLLDQKLNESSENGSV